MALFSMHHSPLQSGKEEQMVFHMRAAGRFFCVRAAKRGLSARRERQMAALRSPSRSSDVNPKRESRNETRVGFASRWLLFSRAHNSQNRTLSPKIYTVSKDDRFMCSEQGPASINGLSPLFTPEQICDKGTRRASEVREFTTNPRFASHRRPARACRDVMFLSLRHSKTERMLFTFETRRNHAKMRRPGERKSWPVGIPPHPSSAWRKVTLKGNCGDRYDESERERTSRGAEIATRRETASSSLKIPPRFPSVASRAIQIRALPDNLCPFVWVSFIACRWFSFAIMYTLKGVASCVMAKASSSSFSLSLAASQRGVGADLRDQF